jgi:hypothetical protein
MLGWSELKRQFPAYTTLSQFDKRITQIDIPSATAGASNRKQSAFSFPFSAQHDSAA